MAILTDIAIEHTYRGKKSPVPLTFTMHPFENSIGEHAGRFEVVRDIESGGKKQKRSAHLTMAELAEMYALRFAEQFEIRLRLRPAGTCYPDAPPAKKVPRTCIKPGTDFDRIVQRVDTTQPISPGLRDQLRRLDL